ncbi:hypothetical protein COO60DRAFT_1671125 [Scenedesmus sp. NREL 46B-D3]|nr:hypothetical protein COO60DRAFT_1671125 [Scenedesmus sp. NREL 46B-D3]
MRFRDYDLTDLTDWSDMKSCCESAARASVIDPECASLPPQPAPKPPPPAPAPVPPPAGPTVDDSYCDPNNDYNLGDTLDWDDMDSCCTTARERSIQDSQCSSLPPRPAPAAPTPAPAPSGASQVVEDYCVGSDYDFSKEEDREYWQDCCSDATSQNVADTECQNPQW